ncbi:MoaD/ThiS family protein [Prosthecochloris sp. HL-130-GSB]|jgi:molybdopterin converting factor subunit 1|uniref:MoaD/ThiS family protein n=1 Tax=Prosthecochloris sp. HL-130-GSB TaxID=1974213 RepID=UPI000A1BFF11|nr:MoaD/ThiS family protein [Prosthecochloris sp. HL-130-GSB]ARM31644.1 molybdopterin synthase sulfur carrier subunit [Prosthecochloris sp. HL-130-GSB]MBO8092903.1 MoaD/ThiS family protein [Prosthecochloris sp.]
MEITVKCFASAREILARSEFSMEIEEGMTIEALERRIRSLSSQLAEMPFMLAVNMEYPEPGTVIRPGDEVAIIPPVSGG